MNTTNRVRAGSPAPILQLHRVDTSLLAKDDGVTVTPIQFAGAEPEHVETASTEDENGSMRGLAMAFLSAFLTLFGMGVGFVLARLFS